MYLLIAQYLSNLVQNIVQRVFTNGNNYQMEHFNVCLEIFVFFLIKQYLFILFNRKYKFSYNEEK